MKRQKVRSKMGVKEKALTAASSIASGDFLRMVTSAGAARKIDYSKLAKAIVEEYNGSTIAGSAQTLKAALDSLNSNCQSVETPKDIDTGTDVLSLNIGEYTTQTNAVAASLVNCPTTSNCKITVYKRTGGRKNILIVDLNGDTFIKTQRGDSDWSPWYVLTKTEVQ